MSYASLIEKTRDLTDDVKKKWGDFTDIAAERAGEIYEVAKVGAQEVGRGAAYLGTRAAAGAVGAADDVWDFAAGGIYKLLGKDEKAQALYDVDKAARVNEAAERIYGEDISQGMQKAGDIAETVGFYAPSYAVSQAASFIPQKSPLILREIARHIAPALQSAGGATKKAYENSQDLDKAYDYGTISGAVDTALDVASSALSAYVPISPHVTKGVATVASGAIKAWLDPYIKRATYDKDAQNASAWDIVSAGTFGGLVDLLRNPDRQPKEVVAQLKPAVEDSAASILAYPEAVAEKYSQLGLVDEDGKPIEVSAEALTEGVDLSGSDEEQIASLEKALASNDTLAAVVSADVAARVARPNKAAEQWSQYINGASEKQIGALANTLGAEVQDYASMQRGARNFASTPRGQEQLRAMHDVERKAKNAPPNDQTPPTVIGTALADGVYRFGGDDGIAIIKEGGTIRLYDYARGLISKPLTTMQVNAALARGRNQQ